MYIVDICRFVLFACILYCRFISYVYFVLILYTYTYIICTFVDFIQTKVESFRVFQELHFSFFLATEVVLDVNAFLTSFIHSQPMFVTKAQQNSTKNKSQGNTEENKKNCPKCMGGCTNIFLHTCREITLDLWLMVG